MSTRCLRLSKCKQWRLPKAQLELSATARLVGLQGRCICLSALAREAPRCLRASEHGTDGDFLSFPATLFLLLLKHDLFSSVQLQRSGLGYEQDPGLDSKTLLSWYRIGATSTFSSPVSIQEMHDRALLISVILIDISSPCRCMFPVQASICFSP